MSTCDIYPSEIFNNTFTTKQFNFSLIHFNIRSIKNKLDSLQIFLESLVLRFKVIVFTETWLTITDDTPVINNYTCIRLNRVGKRGRGVAVYINHSYAYSIIEEYIITNINVECLVIKTSQFQLAAIYRQPAGS